MALSPPLKWELSWWEASTVSLLSQPLGFMVVGATSGSAVLQATVSLQEAGKLPALGWPLGLFCFPCFCVSPVSWPAEAVLQWLVPQPSHVLTSCGVYSKLCTDTAASVLSWLLSNVSKHRITWHVFTQYYKKLLRDILPQSLTHSCYENIKSFWVIKRKWKKVKRRKAIVK